MSETKLSILVEFDEQGELTGVFPNANSDQEMKTLEEAWNRLTHNETSFREVGT